MLKDKRDQGGKIGSREVEHHGPSSYQRSSQSTEIAPRYGSSKFGSQKFRGTVRNVDDAKQVVMVCRVVCNFENSLSETVLAIERSIAAAVAPSRRRAVVLEYDRPVRGHVLDWRHKSGGTPRP